MKSMGELMAEIGFNKDASFESKKAFLKNLIQQANQSQAERTREQLKDNAPVQLELPLLFDAPEKKKKTSA
ncbi:MAG: hypothetical protein CL675_11435 [Bdellovibrionaceae bacterium]|nr:hypothetical protein [Pseudobdellovibrionaceae bacterium]